VFGEYLNGLDAICIIFLKIPGISGSIHRMSMELPDLVVSQLSET
jgi:hypothetical protein